MIPGSMGCKEEGTAVILICLTPTWWFTLPKTRLQRRAGDPSNHGGGSLVGKEPGLLHSILWRDLYVKCCVDSNSFWMNILRLSQKQLLYGFTKHHHSTTHGSLSSWSWLLDFRSYLRSYDFGIRGEIQILLALKSTESCFGASWRFITSQIKHWHLHLH